MQSSRKVELNRTPGVKTGGKSAEKNPLQKMNVLKELKSGITVSKSYALAVNGNKSHFAIDAPKKKRTMNIFTLTLNCSSVA